MSILDPYKAAGVLTFTVRNNEAIADNPYSPHIYHGRTLYINSLYTEFNNLNLPPLPTYSIPDGPVKIEEVEEQRQVYSDGEWIEMKYLFEKFLKTRTVLVPKALRKGEEEKPEGEMKMLYNYLTAKDIPTQFPSIPMRLLNEEWAKKNHSQSLARLNERGGLSPCEALANIEKRQYKSIPVQEAIDALKRIIAASTSQPEKMEQTAEGIELKLWAKVRYAIASSIYRNPGRKVEDGFHGYDEATDKVLKVFESQLAQYKEKIIADLESLLETEDFHFLIYHADGIRDAIDLIRNNNANR